MVFPLLANNSSAKIVLFSIGFLILMASSASAYYTYDFSAATGTDLNTLYGWYFFTDTTGNTDADVNNGVGRVLSSNDGAGGTTITIDSQNLTVVDDGDIIDLNFVYKGYFVNTGSFDTGQIGLANFTGSGIGTNNLYINMIDSNGDFYLRLNGVYRTYRGTLNIDSNYGFHLVRAGSGTFEWNFSENGVIKDSDTNVIGAESLYFFARNSAGGVGTGQTFLQFDNIVAGSPDANAAAGTDTSVIKFFIYNGYNSPIGDMEVRVFKNILGVDTLVTTETSDVTGAINFTLEDNQLYSLEFYYDGNLLYSTDNYVTTYTPVYWYFNMETYNLITTGFRDFTVNFNPFLTYVPSSVTSLEQIVNGAGINHVVVTYFQYPDGNLNVDRNIILTVSQACAGSCTVSTLLTDIPFDSNFGIGVDVNVFFDNNASVAVVSHVYSKYVSAIGVQELFFNARQDFGCSTDPWSPCPYTTIISVLFTLLLLGGIVFSTGFVNGNGLIIFALVSLSFLAYVGWFWWVFIVLMIITAVFGKLGKVVVE